MNTPRPSRSLTRLLGLCCAAGLSAPAIVWGQSANDGFEPNPDGPVRVIAVDPQGRALIGGYFATVDGAIQSHLARLHEDGTVDEAFNVPANDWVYSVAVQADGRILVGGEFSTLGGQPRSGLARLQADGSLDPTFDPAANREVTCLQVQADGKILVGGEFTTLAGQARGRLARLNANGGLDTGFIPEPDDGVYSLALQSDGKILVGGDFTTLGGQPRSHLGRLNSDGSLDATFNPGTDGFVSSLAVQADGKILVGGSFTTLGGVPRERIGRLHPNGSLDTGFNPGANELVRRLAVQTDGKILVGGRFTTLGGQPREHVGRLNPDGSLEIGFNPGANDEVSSFALQTSGRILVGGWFTTLGGQPRGHLGRLNADGSVYRGFDPGADDVVYSLAVQADGKVLVGGSFGTLGGQSRIHLGRLNLDGSLDIGFAPISPALEDPRNQVNGLAVQGDAKILAVGSDVSLTYPPFLLRIDQDGKYVSTFSIPEPGVLLHGLALQPFNKVLMFGEGGIDRLVYGSDIIAHVKNGDTPLALDADGKILFVHYYPEPSYIGRLHSDERDDTTFFKTGVDGSVLVLAMQADGKILVGGAFATLGGQPRSRLGRLNRDGSLDASFNPGPNDYVNSLVMQVDGKILVGGDFTTLGGQSRAHIGRLNPDGSVDSSFNPGANGLVYGLALQADGKILVGGTFTTLGGLPRERIGRLNNGPAAQQTLIVSESGDTVTWLRSGAGPELEQVAMELSFSSPSYPAELGLATRVSGGWRRLTSLTGIKSLSSTGSFFVRAYGHPVGGQCNGSRGLVESVGQFTLRPNTAPQLTALNDVQTAVNTPSAPIPIRVTDAESDPATLTLSAESSNPNLAFAFGGSGTNRTLTISFSATSAPGARGSTPVTVTVSDGQATSSRSFIFSVGVIPGDLNHDGQIDQGELDSVLSQYWPSSPWLEMSDPAKLPDGLFQFALTNASAWLFSVEVTTNFITWAPLGPAYPVYQFHDPASTNSPMRYYRLRWP